MDIFFIDDMNYIFFVLCSFLHWRRIPKISNMKVIQTFSTETQEEMDYMSQEEEDKVEAIQNTQEKQKKNS